jgi:hypothetical protein
MINDIGLFFFVSKLRWCMTPDKTYAMLAAPNTPNLRAPSFLGTCGGLNADQTRLIKAAILSRVLVRSLSLEIESNVYCGLERNQDG